MRWRVLIAVVGVVGLLAAACGDSGGADDAGAEVVPDDAWTVDDDAWGEARTRIAQIVAARWQLDVTLGLAALAGGVDAPTAAFDDIDTAVTALGRAIAQAEVAVGALAADEDDATAGTDEESLDLAGVRLVGSVAGPGFGAESAPDSMADIHIAYGAGEISYAEAVARMAALGFDLDELCTASSSTQGLDVSSIGSSGVDGVRCDGPAGDPGVGFVGEAPTDLLLLGRGGAILTGPGGPVRIGGPLGVESDIVVIRDPFSTLEGPPPPPIVLDQLDPDITHFQLFPPESPPPSPFIDLGPFGHLAPLFGGPPFPLPGTLVGVPPGDFPGPVLSPSEGPVDADHLRRLLAMLPESVRAAIAAGWGLDAAPDGTGFTAECPTPTIGEVTTVADKVEVEVNDASAATLEAGGKTYTNPLGRPAGAVIDTQAFATGSLTEETTYEVTAHNRCGTATKKGALEPAGDPVTTTTTPRATTTTAAGATTTTAPTTTAPTTTTPTTTAPTTTTPTTTPGGGDGPGGCGFEGC